MDLMRDKTLRNETIVLDDAKFVGCHFINCQIRYSGGEVNLDHTTMENCTWDFQGAALRTTALLRGFGILVGDPSSWPVVPQSSIQDI